LRKLLEEEYGMIYMTSNLAARYRRRCEQLHRGATGVSIHGPQQHPLGKLAAWALTSDTKAADLAKQVQSIKKSLEWGLFILVALISYLQWR
jgi:hypothetical protein